MADSKIKDYLKCVWANKATLGGYLGLAISIGEGVIGLNCENSKTESVLSALCTLTSIASLQVLAVTDWGSETLTAYRKTKKYIRSFGKMKEKYNRLNENFYCENVGIRLAAREAGLEDSLID
jgi:hypothetical protein